MSKLSLGPEVVCCQAGVVDAEVDGALQLDGVQDLRTSMERITLDRRAILVQRDTKPEHSTEITAKLVRGTLRFQI